MSLKPETHQFPITDESLWGDEAADLEHDDLFFSYAIEPSSFTKFYNTEKPFRFIRAHKGEGKSGLLKLVKKKAKTEGEPGLIFSTPVSSIMPSPDGKEIDHFTLVRFWKKNIINYIAIRLGERINMAFTGDSLALVEMAEKNGFRSTSFLGVLRQFFSRSEIGMKLPVIEGIPGIEIKFKGPGSESILIDNFEHVVSRYNNGETNIWLLIDDIDKNFANSDFEQKRLAAFFDACGELTQTIPNLHIRTTILPTVWTILSDCFSQIQSHFNQYAIDISWNEREIEHMIRMRIQGFAKRNSLNMGNIVHNLNNRPIVAIIFEDPVSGWKDGDNTPASVLYTLAKRRPRWVIELIKMAAIKATQRKSIKIEMLDIKQALYDFGNNRVANTSSEFSPRCNKIRDIIMAFAESDIEFDTEKLLETIKNKITEQMSFTITGIKGRPTPHQVAALLFEAGLFYARKQYENESYDHFSYAERPHLFTSQTYLAEKFDWEIHPCFHQYLRLRDEHGRIIKPERTFNRGR